MSRYEKNKKLYEKVKTNEYDNYNEKIKSEDVNISGKAMSRQEFREKKKLSLYFDDMDKELEEASSKLESHATPDLRESMREEVNLRDLIEYSKQNKKDNVKIFTNTQHEILSNLNVETEEYDLESIIGEADPENLEFEEPKEEEFDLSFEEPKEIDR